MTETTQGQTRAPRVPWPDRWLLDALRQQGNPAVDRLQPAESAWEAAVAAGADPKAVLDLVCSIASSAPADLAGVGKPQARMLVPGLARRYGVVPVRLVGQTLEVATANPLLAYLERDLAFASGRHVRITVAAPAALRDAFTRIYGSSPSSNGASPAKLEWVVNDVAAGERANASRGAVADALDRLVADALDQRASDIHLEPKDSDLLVRYRVDGVLHDVTRVASDSAPLLMSRLKILAGLDISDRRRPQDGRARTRIEGRTVDLRVSTLPLSDRIEKAVIRVLDARDATNGLDTLGFQAGEAHRAEKLLAQNEGLVLVTGPTGSGKTTTLYSAIAKARSPETNIITVEDPIEYDLEGINQVQVNEKAGLGFAAALRSMLRQDPDIILVGEIRDAETAGIAVKAGMTGHLVLSTLHTIDAPSAIGRLAEIGVEMGALAGALKGVIAQRLVRRLCESCATSMTFSDLPVAQQALLMGRKVEGIRRAVGCEACRGTGYRGRMVVAEVLVVSDEMRSAIARRADRVEIQDLAKRAGMLSMWEAGVRRVLDGSTSLPELLDNVAAPMEETESQQSDVDAIVRQMLAGKGAAPATGVTPPAPRAAPPRLTAQVRALPADAPRVLVVHDSRDERRLLRAALEEAGCAVIEAADGESGLTYAKRLRPALVVTELVLPRLDGIAMVQALAAETGTPAIAYTTQTDAAMHEWAREAGCREIITADRGPDAAAARARAELGIVA